MRRARLALCAVLLGAASAAPRVLLAQAATSLTVTATVDNTALTTSVSQNLAFGTVIPGTPLTINPLTNQAAAALIRIQGAKRANILISFTLPTQLRAGAGPYTMPISFGAASACGVPVFPTGSACTTFDPNVTFAGGQIPNKNPPQNEYQVYLGGTVTPSPTQHGGVYTATIVMTVTY